MTTSVHTTPNSVLILGGGGGGSSTWSRPLTYGKRITLKMAFVRRTGTDFDKSMSGHASHQGRDAAQDRSGGGAKEEERVWEIEEGGGRGGGAIERLKTMKEYETMLFLIRRFLPPTGSSWRRT